MENFKNPQEFDDLIEKGKWHFSRGFYKNAKEIFGEICERDPKNSEALELYAKTLLEMSDWQWQSEALDYLVRAIKVNPLNSGAWNSLGKFYYSTGRTDQAIRCMHRALKYFPHSATIMGNLACAYRKIHQFEKAFQYLQKAMEVHAESPWLHFQVGLTHLLKGYAYHSNIEFSRGKRAFQILKDMELEFDLWKKPSWYNLVEIFLKVPITRKNVGILLNRFVPEHTPFEKSPWFSNRKQKGNFLTPHKVQGSTIH